MVVGPNKDRIQELKEQLAREFCMKDLEPTNKILWMQIHQDKKDRKICLFKKNYLQNILWHFNKKVLNPISTLFPNNYKLSSSMSPSNEAKRMKMSWASYASMMGSFMYAMICTRPNITQAMGTISRFMTDRSREHWNAIKRILRYIKGTLDVTLRFEGLKHFVTGCVDFGFVGDLDKGRSINSFVFTLARRAMSWLSK